MKRCIEEAKFKKNWEKRRRDFFLKTFTDTTKATVMETQV